MKGRALLAVVIIAVGYLAIAKFANLYPFGRPKPAVVRRECPIDTVFIDSTATPSPRTVTMVPLAGNLSHIPEFHDCQRFIKGLKYDSMYAIFAAQNLAKLGLTGLVAPATRGARGVTGGTVGGSGTSTEASGSAFAFAEIYSWGGTYGELGIKPGFNCLYVYVTNGTASATMLSGTAADSTCPAKSFNELATRGMELLVHTPRTWPGMNDTDYPPVARWDYDGTTQFIGIRCGAAWCEIGPKGGFNASPDVPAMPAFTDMTGYTPSSNQSSRVSLVRGWYDYQVLAIKDGTGPTHPSIVRGLVVPNPTLGDIGVVTTANPTPVAAFAQGWMLAAKVYVSDNYHGRVVQFTEGWNDIYVCDNGDSKCTGLTKTCPGGWYARVGASGTPQCESRWDHTAAAANDHYHIPGVARWRWLANDETVWKRCVEGCCELQ